MEHMTAGYDSGDKSALQAVAYVSFQELATRVSHRNTGAATGCPIAEQLLARIAADENLHMVFYRNLMAAALDRPGRHDGGDPRRGGRVHHARRRHDGLPAQLRHHRQGRHLRPAAAPRRGDHAGAEVLEDLRPQRLRAGGEQARDEMVAFLAELDARATRFVEQRQKLRDRQAARAGK